MSRWLSGFLAAAIIAGILTGCWDLIEIQQRAFITGIGVDTVDGGPSPSDRFLITMEIPKLTSTAQGGGTQAGGGEGNQSQGFWLLSGTGPTLFSAARDMATRSNLALFVGQTRVVVIGEEAARHGLRKIFDLFTREKEFTRKFRVLVARGKAVDLFKITPPTTDVISTYIYEIMENSRKTDRFIKQKFDKVLEDLMETGNTYVPRVTPGKTDLKVAGSAIIKNWRMVGWLGEQETAAVGLVLGKVQGGSVDVPAPSSKNEVISFEILDAKSKVVPIISGSRARFTVHISIRGRLAEFAAVGSTAGVEMIHSVESAVAQQVRRTVEETIAKLQTQFNADILRFGWLVKKQCPRAWENIGNRWSEIFPEAEVNVQVDVRICDAGRVI